MFVTLLGIIISPSAIAEHARNELLEASANIRQPSTYPLMLRAPHGEPVAVPSYKILGTL